MSPEFRIRFTSGYRIILQRLDRRRSNRGKLIGRIMEQEPSQRTWRIPGWVKTVVPILVSAGILYYYFRDQDWRGLYEILAEASVPLALIGLVIPQIVYWVLDSFISQRTVQWFHGYVPVKDVFFVRGATYLLSLINNSLARGGLIAYLVRKAEIGLSKLLGIQIFRIGLMIWGFMVYLAVITATAQFLDVGLEKQVNLWVWWGYIIFNIMWLVEAWLFWHHNINIGLSRLIVKRENEFWSGWNQSKPRH